jgi:hypothetical protein
MPAAWALAIHQQAGPRKDRPAHVKYVSGAVPVGGAANPASTQVRRAELAAGAPACGIFAPPARGPRRRVRLPLQVTVQQTTLVRLDLPLSCIGLGGKYAVANPPAAGTEPRNPAAAGRYLAAPCSRLSGTAAQPLA